MSAARVTVHCTSASCGWSTQRRRETALERPCLRCRAEVRLADVSAGRPRLPEDQRRVLLRAWVLPATLEWLEGGLGVTPAEYLDGKARAAAATTTTTTTTTTARPRGAGRPR